MKLFRFLILLSVFVAIFSVGAYALDTSAQSAILINADTFSVIYSKNAEQRLPMASTTKIMTGLLLAEQNCDDKIITTTKEMVYVEGSSMGLKVGDTVSFGDLLYGIMLPSGNDAANTAAIAISGSTENFAKKMNAKVVELGLHNTNFVTPSGLDAEGHFTTAYDLSVITAYALRNESFAKAAASKTKTVTISGNRVTLTNHNKLLKMYDGVIGVKTGYTSRSGRCLVSAAKRGSTTLIAVTLNDKNDWQDHIDMLNYGFKHTEDAVIFPNCSDKLPLLSANDNYLELEFEPLSIGVDANEDITYKVFLPPVVTAPVSKGEIIGYTEFYSNGRLIATKNIKSKLDYANDFSNVNFFDKLSRMYLFLIRSI